MSIRKIINNLVESPYICYNGDSAYLLYDKDESLLRFKINSNNDDIDVLLLQDGFTIDNFVIKETNKIVRMNQLIGDFLNKKFR